jgi:hypothetical protein
MLQVAARAQRFPPGCVKTRRAHARRRDALSEEALVDTCAQRSRPACRHERRRCDDAHLHACKALPKLGTGCQMSRSRRVRGLLEGCVKPAVNDNTAT